MITDEDILQQEDLVIFGRMKEFLAREEVSSLPAAKHLNILIDRGRGKEAVQRKITALQAPPPPIIPKNNKKPKLLDIDPLELARQLTIVESELYQKITPVECIQRAREQKDDYNDSIATVIQTSNKIADWVAVSILNKEDSRRRAACLKQFIAVADKCRMLQNFSTMVAITSGLNTTPIRRLKRTWEHVTPKSIATLQACEKVLESARNYNSYRTAMANVSPPCVPFIGVFLTTLTFIQDGAKDNLPGNMVNFRKRMRAAEVIQDIKRWQAQPFLFTPVPSILAYIHESLESKYDGDVRDVFWNLSLEREPREREDERMARLLQESGFL
jgi:son of sevenless-like protein